MAKLDVDPETGIVRSGRFAGHHVDEVMDYLENLETATVEGRQPAGDPPAPKEPVAPKKEPKEELEARAGGRVDAIANIAGATALRLEQDDEEEFARTIGDYDKKGPDGKSYREKIAEMKKNMPAISRTQRGTHKNAYLFLKMQEADIQEKILGRREEVEDEYVQDPPAPETPEVPETPPAATPPAQQKVTPPAAKPAPPAAPPGARPNSGGRRQAPPPPSKPALKATEKVQRLATSFGMTTEAYLKMLEDQGVTQDVIDTMSVPRNAGAPGTPGGRRRTVYDNV